MKKISGAALALALLAATSAAAQEELDMAAAHESMLFHMVEVELDYAGAQDDLWNWNANGWIGGDTDRLWFRSKGEIAEDEVETAEAQLFYGRNFHPFWDALVGVRQDFEPDGETYLAAGIAGLAPYFFETEATGFLSTEGDLSARLEQSFELPVTQRLIAQPHAELGLFAQDVPEKDVGAGFSSVEAGLQLRYEITRKFAPYVDLVWERDLGETASIARANGEDVDSTTLRFGIRAWF